MKGLMYVGERPDEGPPRNYWETLVAPPACLRCKRPTCGSPDCLIPPQGGGNLTEYLLRRTCANRPCWKLEILIDWQDEKCPACKESLFRQTPAGKKLRIINDTGHSDIGSDQNDVTDDDIDCRFHPDDD